MMMRDSPVVIQAPKLGVLHREVFPITSYFQFPGYQANRTYGVRICYPRQLRFCQSESVESVVDESLNFRTVPDQSLCLAGKEDAKVVLTPNSMKLRPEEFGAIARVSDEIGSDGQPYSVVPYLLDLGLDMDQIKSITRRQPDLEGKVNPTFVEFLLILGVNQADIDTILSKRPELRGISLTEKLIPTMIYLECLGLDKKKWAKVIYRCPGLLTMSRQKLKRTVDYLYELGLTAESVGKILTRCPQFISLSVEENLRPTSQYFRSVGVDIAHLVCRSPEVFGLSVTKNIIPTMEYLESLGVDKNKWAKVIQRCPGVLTFSRRKMKAVADFFYELGLTVESVGKILTRYPQIVSYNVEENLRPTAEYLNALGVDVAVLVYQAPQILCLSIPNKLKPATDFFLEQGYTIEEVRTMFSLRGGNLFSISLQNNLIPKWEFFLTMDYPKSELIRFPQYFSYSLEERIKRRYAMVRESGVRFCLNELLTVSEPVFEKVLKRRVKKQLDGLVGSDMEGLKL